MPNSDNQQETGTPEKKKISLEEAIKRKLASKKQAQAADKSSFQGAGGSKVLKSQNTKKQNNLHRRTGGS